VGKGRGFGKTIFFGEHFTVYGTPVIASALSLTAQAEVHRASSGGWQIQDDRKESKGYKETKKGMQIESLERIFSCLKFRPDHLRVNLSGDLPAISGIGATAASSVAIVRALSDEFGLNLSDDEVNAASYEAEIAYHGPRTVGIDNRVATYGGILCLVRGERVETERIILREPVEVVIGNTGIVASTKVMLEGFAERKKRFPEKYTRLIEEARALAEDGLRSIKAFDLREIGRLMDQNHRLLKEAEVSCPELDFLVELSRKEGAWGAKQTGSGGGGCMLALTPEKSLQERVAQAIEREGFQAIRASVGGISDL
jgi:mevalonate kinase